MSSIKRHKPSFVEDLLLRQKLRKKYERKSAYEIKHMARERLNLLYGRLGK